MSNQERAAEVIWEEQAAGIVKPRDLVDALADAGLLMPEPDYNTGSMIIWDHVSHSVTYNKFLGVSLIAEVKERSLSIDEAREIAYALLAAAKLAEESTNGA